jgi:hypothetical protein
VVLRVDPSPLALRVSRTWTKACLRAAASVLGSSRGCDCQQSKRMRGIKAYSATCYRNAPFLYCAASQLVAVHIQYALQRVVLQGDCTAHVRWVPSCHTPSTSTISSPYLHSNILTEAHCCLQPSQVGVVVLQVAPSPLALMGGL